MFKWNGHLRPHISGFFLTNSCAGAFLPGFSSPLPELLCAFMVRGTSPLLHSLTLLSNPHPKRQNTDLLDISGSEPHLPILLGPLISLGSCKSLLD